MNENNIQNIQGKFENLKEIDNEIKEYRSYLQRVYFKIAAESWDKNSFSKSDLCINQIMKKLEKVEARTVRIFIEFNRENYYIDFNLHFGHPNFDKIDWIKV